MADSADPELEIGRMHEQADSWSGGRVVPDSGNHYIGGIWNEFIRVNRGPWGGWMFEGDIGIVPGYRQTLSVQKGLAVNERIRLAIVPGRDGR